MSNVRPQKSKLFDLCTITQTEEQTMRPLRIGECLRSATLALAALMCLETAMAQAPTPSDSQWSTWLRVCAGGVSNNLTVQIDLAFKRWREGVARGQVSAGAGSLGGVLAKMPVDTNDSQLYRDYLSCLDKRMKEWERATNPKAAAQDAYGHLLTAAPAYVFARYGDRDDKNLDSRPEFESNGRILPRGTIGSCRLLMHSASYNLRYPRSDTLTAAASACRSTEAFKSATADLERDWRILTTPTASIVNTWKSQLASQYRTCLSERSGVPGEFLQGVEVLWRTHAQEESVRSIYCAAESEDAIGGMVRTCDRGYRGGDCQNCSEITGVFRTFAVDYYLGSRSRRKLPTQTIANEITDKLIAGGIDSTKQFRDCVLFQLLPP